MIWRLALPRRLPESTIRLRAQVHFRRTASATAGFTLVELMIVVAILALLITLAVPSYLRARERTQMVSMTTTLQNFANQFTIFNVEERTWPDNRGPGVYPNRVDGVVYPGMQQMIPLDVWNTPPIYGGEFDWDHDNRGVTAAICVVNCLATNEEKLAMDDHIDDGNLNKGSFRRVGLIGFRIVLQDDSD